MKIGILGLGSIGTRHAENLRALGHTVIGFDIEVERMSMFNDDCVHADRKGLLTWADAVVIATPSDNHLNDLADVLSFRKPALVEKPIHTGELEKVEALISLAERDGLKVFVGYNLRFHPCVVLAREWLRDGKIGVPIFGAFIVAQLNAKYKEDVIVNWSHEIDLAIHLLGVPTNITSRVDGRAASLAIVHKTGASSAIHLNYITSPQARFFHIVGSEGSIYVNLAAGTAERVDASGRDPHFAQTNGFDRSYVYEMQAFAEALGGFKTELATGREGLDVLRVCLGAQP